MKYAFWKYLGSYMLIYLSLSIIEIFLGKELIDFISTDFWIHFAVYCFLFLVINPVLCRYIGDWLEHNYKNIKMK